MHHTFCCVQSPKTRTQLFFHSYIYVSSYFLLRVHYPFFFFFNTVKRPIFLIAFTYTLYICIKNGIFIFSFSLEYRSIGTFAQQVNILSFVYR